MRCHLFVLGLLAACGGSHRDAAAPSPGPDAAPRATFTEDTARETVASLVDFLAVMADTVERRADDCDAMAADLDALFTRTQPLFDVVHAARVDPDAQVLLVRAADDRAAEIAPLSARIGDGLAACKASQAVFDVMRRMPEL